MSPIASRREPSKNLVKSEPYLVENVSRLAPLVLLPWFDGNIILQLLEGLISLKNPSNILFNGLFTVAGPGSWITAATLRGPLHVRIKSVLLVVILIFASSLYSLFIVSVLNSLIWLSASNIVHYSAAVAVTYIGLTIAGVSLPKVPDIRLFKKTIPGAAITPFTIFAFGIFFGVVIRGYSLDPENTLVDYQAINIIDSALAIIFIISIAVLSIFIATTLGYHISEVVDAGKLQIAAGIGVVYIGLSLGGIVVNTGFEPLIIALIGLAISFKFPLKSKEVKR